MQSFENFYIISESTRRDLLKQITGTVLGSFLSPTGIVSGHDVTEVFKNKGFTEAMIMSLQSAVAKKKGIKSWGWPTDIQEKFESDVMNTLKGVTQGIIPKSEMFRKSFALYSTCDISFSELEKSVKVGVATLLKGESQDEIDIISRFVLADKTGSSLDTMRMFTPAKDIIVNGKVVIPAADFIKFGYAVPPEEAAKNIANAIVSTKDIEAARSSISDFRARQQLHQQYKQKKDSITYSRFDTAGGNEDDDYKLALDSVQHIHNEAKRKLTSGEKRENKVTNKDETSLQRGMNKRPCRLIRGKRKLTPGEKRENQVTSIKLNK